MDAKQHFDAEITKKTTEAIVADGPPPVVNNKPVIAVLDPQIVQQQQPRRPNPKDRGDTSRRMCRMFFPSSGRMGFNMITESDEMPPIETVRDMIAYETRLRLSQSMQELMDFYHADEDSVT